MFMSQSTASVNLTLFWNMAVTGRIKLKWGQGGIITDVFIKEEIQMQKHKDMCRESHKLVEAEGPASQW